MPTYVAVCGASAAGAEQLRLAEAVGRLLAERGAVVVCGGLGGVTEAASKGAIAKARVANGGSNRKATPPVTKIVQICCTGAIKSPLATL